MKKTYISPQTDLLMLKMEWGVCLNSIEQYLLEEGYLDPDSD